MPNEFLLCGCGKPLSDCNCDKRPKFINGVWDYIGNDSYVKNFSEEWDKHRHTQVDSKGYQCGYNTESNSKDSFIKKTQTNIEFLKDKIVLDVGCGVGRYAEILAPYVKKLICIDMSDAVFHCAKLLKDYKNCIFIRADIQNLPIKQETLDFVFSIGVIHHTCDPLISISNIHKVLKENGLFSMWVYSETDSYKNKWREKIREFTTNPDNYEWVWKFASLAPYLREIFRSDKSQTWTQLHQVLGISNSTNNEECVLDTFDWLTPKYQYQYTDKTAEELLRNAGFKIIKFGRIPVSTLSKKSARAIRIHYTCPQKPGEGGASTEVYETIKRLRADGHVADATFIVGTREDTNMCDPDCIGGIKGVMWKDNIIYDESRYDIFVGKNYEGPWRQKNVASKPRVYLTSGIDYISYLKKEYSSIDISLPANGFDLRAFDSSNYAIVHSSIDMKYYKKHLSEKELSKVCSNVIHTPNLAIPCDNENFKDIPYKEKKYDICFSASDWNRLMKNGNLMRSICRNYRGRRIVICGLNANVVNSAIRDKSFNRRKDVLIAEIVGLVSHKKMCDILANSKIVVIPSLYDPSPNLYVEAVKAGCNVVASFNVGNIINHPRQLMARDMRFESFTNCIDYALQLDKQLSYEIKNPDDVLNELVNCFNDIIQDFNSKKTG